MRNAVNDLAISQLVDALEAPLSALHQLTQRVTCDRTTTSSAEKRRKISVVRSVIIGQVPDRGGRTNETRPKLSDISPSYSQPGRGGGGLHHGGGKNQQGGRGGDRKSQRR